MAGHSQAPPALVFAPQRLAALMFFSCAMTRLWFMGLFVNFSFPPLKAPRRNSFRFSDPIMRAQIVHVRPLRGGGRTWCFRAHMGFLAGSGRSAPPVQSRPV